jgi:hypothetical protein
MVPAEMQWNVINVTYAIKYFRSGMVLSDIFAYTVKRLTNVRPVTKHLQEVITWTPTEELTLERSHTLALSAINALVTEDP